MTARRGHVVPRISALETVSHELAAAEVLSRLDRDELMKLAPLCRVTADFKGQAIFVPGDKAAVYLVARGRVVVVAGLEAGVEIELFSRRQHQLFGEASGSSSASSAQLGPPLPAGR